MGIQKQEHSALLSATVLSAVVSSAHCLPPPHWVRAVWGVGHFQEVLGSKWSILLPPCVHGPRWRWRIRQICQMCWVTNEVAYYSRASVWPNTNTCLKKKIPPSTNACDVGRGCFSVFRIIWRCFSLAGPDEVLMTLYTWGIHTGPQSIMAYYGITYGTAFRLNIYLSKKPVVTMLKLLADP